MNLWQAFWYEALSSQLGIIISTSDPEAARQRLYKARRELKDESLDELSIRISPTHPESQIWILKNTKVTPNEKS